MGFRNIFYFEDQNLCILFLFGTLPTEKTHNLTSLIQCVGTCWHDNFEPRGIIYNNTKSPELVGTYLGGWTPPNDPRIQEKSISSRRSLELPPNFLQFWKVGMMFLTSFLVGKLISIIYWISKLDNHRVLEILATVANFPVHSY